ncbi:MAG: hypothetical protein QHH06_04260 [Clostridiales bacterium]|jgi:hypothetical protein|nr:hypothetical protein [Eubacteriales bacterium]MDH7565680.1 hypothetical protein [Clostridiales bacterium]
MPLNSNGQSSISFLDRIRINNGVDALKAHFHDLLTEDPGKAVDLINDRNLHFPSLFALQPEIIKLDLFNRLSTNNQCALNIANGILTKQLSISEFLPIEYKQTTYSAFKWILETGYMDDGLNDQYDEILETAAILLVKIYRDVSCLHIIAEMVFNRHRKGFPIYDLIWAFFEARIPESLTLIAERLRSGRGRDVELARKLLKFIPAAGMNADMDNNRQYTAVINWINENHPFLHYKGESFQQTGSPEAYTLSLESKYLCKNTLTDSRNVLRSLSEEESTLLDRFRALQEDTKLILANYSYRLYRRNPRQWQLWVRYPLGKQISIAKAMLGGLP